ncbi:hypothetical protein BCU70_21800 [Vibrio sp. 10N.286.49.C2]|uniref:hypothetical protein n=1 Tax=unclassified Vibrio TaxID=2614977 RepID=UPI000C867C2B|nr:MULTISPECIES: hypothetical protein [unclassified Vibrio]PMH30334.1 hypothetical protein BCU70_21800 [Vibrio sp. 10N.286.49.C2]PMH50845.1 hypothetical protein BCU66_17950 [Vibrio sp. 10N.286.49.B1]PMH79557.1 hypothetical protein BCU58_04825 [Vibrio sp. 10N.286.48.B7]
MNRHNIVGVLFALIALFLSVFFIVEGSQFSFYQWIPEAFHGLVFSFVWGFGVSTFVGYAYAAMTFVTIAVVSFAYGHKVSRLFSHSDEG